MSKSAAPQVRHRKTKGVCLLPIFAVGDEWADWEDHVHDRALALRAAAKQGELEPPKKRPKRGGGGGAAAGGGAGDAEAFAQRQLRHNTHAAAVLQCFVSSDVLTVGIRGRAGGFAWDVSHWSLKASITLEACRSSATATCTPHVARACSSSQFQGIAL